MSNMVPKSAAQILERSLHTVRIRANSNGECFGGEIADALREAGVALGVDRLEVLLIRRPHTNDGIAGRELSSRCSPRLRKSDTRIKGSQIFERGNCLFRKVENV